MSYNPSHVRAFLGAAEMALFESSFGERLKALAPADLQRRIVRARTLRDKNRDLLRRQKLQTRARTGSKTGRTGHANERTAKKAVAFDEALKRFEAQAAAAKKAAAKKAAAKKRPAKKVSAGKAPAKKAVAKKTLPGKSSASRAASAKVARPRRLIPAATVLREALEKKHAVEAERAAGAAPSHHTKGSAGATGVAPGGLGPTTPAVRSKVVASRMHEANLEHIQGHTSTQVRQAQAKRDQRG